MEDSCRGDDEGGAELLTTLNPFGLDDASTNETLG
jgi:hypothetical protein